MALEKITQAQESAAALRRMAAELILQAEALEATAPQRKPRKVTNSIVYNSPVTGKVDVRLKKLKR